MNIVSLFIFCFLYSYGILLIYITYLAKKRGEKGAFINNFFVTLVFIGSITIYLFSIYYINPVGQVFLAFPFDILLISFIFIFIPLFFLLVFREKMRIKGKNLRNRKIKQFKLELPLKYEIYRKLTHLVVLGIILFYFTLGYLIQDFFIYFLEFFPQFQTRILDITKDTMIFTQNLVIFLVGISLIGLLTADFIRILIPKYYPLKPINLLLREKEMYMRLGPQISMSISCFSTIILFGYVQPLGPLVISASMTMAIFGDIASNLIGKSIGKKQIRNTNKTYEGLYAGIITAFISGIAILLLLRNYYNKNLFFLFFIPSIGALIIGIIDYVNLEIDDNLSYNFSLSIILFFISILLI